MPVLGCRCLLSLLRCQLPGLWICSFSLFYCSVLITPCVRRWAPEPHGWRQERQRRPRWGRFLWHGQGQRDKRRPEGQGQGVFAAWSADIRLTHGSDPHPGLIDWGAVAGLAYLDLLWPPAPSMVCHSDTQAVVWGVAHRLIGVFVCFVLFCFVFDAGDVQGCRWL